jgi:REP element-mobilizing transposase RayT
MDQLGLFTPAPRPKHKRGRPPGTRVSHARRPAVSAKRPHHVTIRVRHGVWNLRSQRCFSRIAGALGAVRGREGFRVLHFSVQGNHMHLVTEARDRAALSNGMRALLIRIAHSINALMGSRGRLYADRYHERIVSSRTQMRNVLRYVLENHARHMQQIGKGHLAAAVDGYSSAVRNDLVSSAESWLACDALAPRAGP